MSQTKPPSPPPQNKLLNRVSGLFQKRRPDESEASSSSSSTPAGPSGSTSGSGRSITPPSESDALSRVDSMFSSFQSTRSTFNPHQNTSPPLRTVSVENAIIHEEEVPLTQPAPVAAHAPAVSTSTHAGMAAAAPSGTLGTISSSTAPPLPASANQEEVDEAFEKLLQEYALPANLRPNLNQLTMEQKAVLLQSSQSRMMLRKNTSTSRTLPFMLSATLGLQRKEKRQSVRSSKFFQSEGGAGGNPADAQAEPQRKKASQSTSGRPSRRRTSILAYGDHHGSSSKTVRNKLKSSPEYFVQVLKETPFRELDEADVMDLRVFLRSVVASWTTEFIHLGGYEAISEQFRQMKEAPKRSSNDDKMIQHLAKCFKAIMAHELGGTQKVLTEPSAVEHIRDLLLGPVNQKQKALYCLHITTRALLLNLLCTLATLQVKADEAQGTAYVHGYDLLRRLLLDRPADRVPEEEEKSDLPFRMSLKTDPRAVMTIILENDPDAAAAATGSDGMILPRYTAWMRELQFTVEKHIEPIGFLAGALDYKFESAFRQLKIKSTGEADEAAASNNKGPAEGLVTADEGVIDYLVTHLRLICTLVTTPATTFTGHYNEREQEKVRTEVMLSGFEKVSKSLQACPHPTLYASYNRYLLPLLRPWADLNAPAEQSAGPVQHGSIQESVAEEWEDMNDEEDDLASLGLYEGDLSNLDLYDDIFDEDEDDEVGEEEDDHVYYQDSKHVAVPAASVQH